MQKVLDEFYWLRKRIVTAVAYLSLRLYGSETTWRDLWNGTFPSRKHQDLDLSQVGDIELVLAEAKQGLRNAEARQASVTDKCKTLLTLASLLVALIGALLSKTQPESIWLRVLFFASMLALLNSVTLICQIFDVR